MPTPHLQPRKGRRWRRRLALVTGLGLASMLLVLLLAPWWTPWLVRPVAGLLGANVTTTSRDGYWRLKLQNVRLKEPGVELSIDEVSLLQPVAWLIERVAPGSLTSPIEPAIEVHGCQVELTEVAVGSTPSRITSTAQALSEGLRIARQVAAWVAHARITDGSVVAGKHSLSVPAATWDTGSLALEIEHEKLGAPIKLGLSLLERPGFEIEIDHGLAGVDLWLVEQEPARQWEAKGEANALEGTGELEATFSGNEWLPASLNLDVGDIQWPGDRLPIPGWVRSPSAEIHVAGGFPAYEIGCDAGLTVRFDGVLEQEIRTRLRSATSTNGVLLNSVTATTGGLEVMLAEPVAIPLAWPPTGTNAILNIQSDLSDLSDSAVEGVLRGTLTITPGADLIPGATLRLRGTDMAAAGKSLGGLTLDASLNWPELRLDDFKLGNPDSSLTATGRVNLASRELGSLHWQLDGLPFAVTNLANPTRLTASGQFSGSLTDPHQEGTLEAEGLDFSGLYPMNVRADWSGAGFVLTNFLARASANTGELVVGGAMKANLGGTTPALDINLQQLALLRGGQPLLRLSRPSTVAIDLPKIGTTTAASPRIAVPDLNLTGDTRKLQLSGAVAWPGQGEIHAEAAGLQATDLRDFVPNLPDWMRLDRLNLATGWTNGPAAFNLEGQFALAPIPQEPLVLDAKILGTGTNIALQTVRIRRQEEALAELAGELPLTLEPGAPSGLVRLHPEGKLLTRLKADQAGPLWSELTRRLGVTTVNPSLTVTLTGTGRAPRGHVQFVADEMRSENALAGLTAPPVENPKFTATLDDTGKLTAAAEMQIAGQRGTFSGTLPLDLATLTNASSEFRLPDLTPLEARLRLPNWQISALAMFAPGLLAPQGTLDLDVSVKPGLRFSGLLQLTNLVTKPLEPVGVLRQVHATARLAKHGITLENAGAMLGSQPLIVKGAWEFGTNGTPGYAFSITGTNLPLVRQPDVFLRGDLGLRLSGTNLSNALVSGNVTLKNSLFLRDLQSLVSGNVEVPSARPPFFSIEQPPLADWRLDVKVAGEQFLHVVTPVFRGRVSAALQLGGTLREPVALGDVSLPSGTVTFPFGGLKVDSGRVSLTRGNPFVPSITFQASGLNFGYDVRMNVSGSVTTPNVLFSSVPPLSSMEILLMLTSGDIPGDAFSYSSRSRMQQIGMFVGKEFLGKLTGDPENDRLTMRSGEEVTDRGQLTYTIEYRLSPRWSLFGNRDRFDSYGAGIKWRVFSR